MLVVVKMRRSKHAIDMFEYQITDKGVEVGEPLRGYRGLTSGVPEPWSAKSGQEYPETREDHPPDEPPPKKPRGRKKP
jgi:hypothetical protein